MSYSLPLLNKTALITGASRRRGIGFAVAVKLASLGANVFIHHFRPHDERLPWGGDDLDDVRAGVRSALVGGAQFGDMEADLTEATTVSQVLDAAFALTGDVDILVCNHARSGGDGSILDMTAECLDAFWDTNTRSTLLLTAEFARRKSGLVGGSPLRPGDPVPFQGPFKSPVGRVFWMTSGQIADPMPGEHRLPRRRDHGPGAGRPRREVRRTSLRQGRSPVRSCGADRMALVPGRSVDSWPGTHQ